MTRDDASKTAYWLLRSYLEAYDVARQAADTVDGLVGKLNSAASSFDRGRWKRFDLFKAALDALKDRAWKRATSSRLMPLPISATGPQFPIGPARLPAPIGPKAVAQSKR